MSRAGTAILAGGVFAAVFAVSWLALPHLNRATSKAAVEQAAFGVLEKAAREQAGVGSGGATVSEKRALELADGDESAAVIYQIKGIDLPQDLVDSARGDGPPSPAYMRFALIDVGDGWKTTCLSFLGEDKKRLEHAVIRYSATGMDEEGGDLPPLARYIQSGCAKAVRDHGSLLTIVQYNQKLLQILPKTKAYDDQRRQIIDGISASRYQSR